MTVERDPGQDSLKNLFPRTLKEFNQARVVLRAELAMRPELTGSIELKFLTGSIELKFHKGRYKGRVVHDHG
jgi:hypothetical protein